MGRIGECRLLSTVFHQPPVFAGRQHKRGSRGGRQRRSRRTALARKARSEGRHTHTHTQQEEAGRCFAGHGSNGCVWRGVGEEESLVAGSTGGTDRQTGQEGMASLSLSLSLCPLFAPPPPLSFNWLNDDDRPYVALCLVRCVCVFLTSLSSPPLPSPRPLPPPLARP